MKTREMAFIAMLAAFLCVLAPFSVPAGVIPITLATFAVYVAAAVSGKREGTIAVILYILIGGIGVPVFSGFTGGFQKIAGVTGGYLVGFIPCAFLTGWLIDRHEKRKWIYPLAMAAGTLVCYALGTAWYCVLTKTGLSAALTMCVVPFLAADAVKIAAASAVSVPLRPRIRRIIGKGR